MQLIVGFPNWVETILEDDQEVTPTVLYIRQLSRNSWNCSIVLSIWA